MATPTRFLLAWIVVSAGLAGTARSQCFEFPQASTLTSPNGCSTVTLQPSADWIHRLGSGDGSVPTKSRAQAKLTLPGGTIVAYALSHPVMPGTALLLDSGDLVTLGQWITRKPIYALQRYDSSGTLAWSKSMSALVGTDAGEGAMLGRGLSIVPAASGTEITISRRDGGVVRVALDTGLVLDRGASSEVWRGPEWSRCLGERLSTVARPSLTPAARVTQLARGQARMFHASGAKFKRDAVIMNAFFVLGAGESESRKESPEVRAAIWAGDLYAELNEWPQAVVAYRRGLLDLPDHEVPYRLCAQLVRALRALGLERDAALLQVMARVRRFATLTR